MAKLTHIEIPVTAENLFFIERQLNLFDYVELFPFDAVSQSSGSPGIPITLKTDKGFDIESDIDHSKMALRNRSKYHGWTRWTAETNLQDGDIIVIEKISERIFSLSCVKKNSE